MASTWEVISPPDPVIRVTLNIVGHRSIHYKHVVYEVINLRDTDLPDELAPRELTSER